ncbi:MAG: hypothetical protein GY719_14280 [bacterium]|nr:hypothetical protein [bacterium]
MSSKSPDRQKNAAPAVRASPILPLARPFAVGETAERDGEMPSLEQAERLGHSFARVSELGKGGSAASPMPLQPLFGQSLPNGGPGEPLQLKPVKYPVTGISHLVQAVSDSIFEGNEVDEVSAGQDLMIEDEDVYISRRGPNQEDYQDLDEIGEQIYPWYRVLGIEGGEESRDVTDLDYYVREDVLDGIPKSKEGAEERRQRPGEESHEEEKEQEVEVLRDMLEEPDTSGTTEPSTTGPKGESKLGKLGKNVGLGFLGAALGPFKFLFKHYRKDLRDDYNQDYGNKALNGFQKTSNFTGYMAAMMGWAVLVFGLAAAIFAATGFGAGIAVVLAGTVPIFGWLAASFAAATSVLKAILAICGAIRTWNMEDGVEKARLRAMMWGDVLAAITNAGAAAVGGTFAAAGGGSYTSGSLGSQVSTAVKDPVKGTGQHMLEQTINQGFNTGFDVINEFAPDVPEAQELHKKTSKMADKAWTDIAVPGKKDGQLSGKAVKKLAPVSRDLQEASKKDPKEMAEKASKGEVDVEDSGGKEDEPIQEAKDKKDSGGKAVKARVEKRSKELEGADGRQSVPLVDKNVSDAEAAAKEAKSTKKPGFFKRLWNKLFSGVAKKAKKKMLAVSGKLGGLSQDDVAVITEAQERMEANQRLAPDLEGAVSEEKKIRDQVDTAVKKYGGGK